ncbi:MAG: WYL domain-containing protein [Bacteroidales bacterium]|nr:WYL domain-containing protein [Bacteroidales bacterium]
MARNFFNRYVWLIDTIQRYKYIQFDDLQREWNRSVLNENGQELAQRTFFNHKDAIADMFGIDIKYDKARGYYIAEEELNFEGFRNWLLSSLSINNLLLECSDMRDRILFDEVPGGQQYVKTVVDAMRASTELEVTYQRFLDDEPRTFNLQPYCIKCFKQRWYVFGKNSYDKKLKCYAFDRVMSMHSTDKKFKVPKSFDAKEYFEPLYGIVGGGEKPELVKIKVIDEQRGHIRTLPLHSSQKETETKEEYSIFSYYMVPSFDFLMELLSMEDMVEVLAPEKFRKEIKRQIDGMYRLYKQEKRHP